MNMAHIEGELLYWINNLQPHHWVMILAGAVVIGTIFLKSAGNKSRF